MSETATTDREDKVRKGRPSILDEIIEEIDEGVLKDQLVKAKKQLEEQLLEVMANVRLQEDIVDQKERVLEDDEGDYTDREEKLLNESAENARLTLQDRYQGAVALSNELRRVNTALQEMKDAGRAPFGNRATRRNKHK